LGAGAIALAVGALLFALAPSGVRPSQVIS
jgi:hypothetical protein